MLVTDEEGIATSGDIPIATYKDGKMKKEIEYILVETKAPDGYVRSEKEESIVFTYQDDKTKEIEITKELTNERIPTGDYVKSPKTGDDTNIWLPILLLVLSVGDIFKNNGSPDKAPEPKEQEDDSDNPADKDDKKVGYYSE